MSQMNKPSKYLTSRHGYIMEPDIIHFYSSIFRAVQVQLKDTPAILYLISAHYSISLTNVPPKAMYLHLKYYFKWKYRSIHLWLRVFCRERYLLGTLQFANCSPMGMTQIALALKSVVSGRTFTATCILLSVHHSGILNDITLLLVGIHCFNLQIVKRFRLLACMMCL